MTRALAAVTFGPAERDVVLGCAARGLDWTDVLRAVETHGVQPVAYARLRPLSEAEGREIARLPDVVDYLRRTTSARAALALFLSSEMAMLSRELRSAAIPYLVLKGPSLTEAYGMLSARPFVDNDLLIERSDFDRLDALLRSLGFQRRERSPARQAGYLFIHGEHTFGRLVAGQISTTDVHTALVPPGLFYSDSVSDLLARSRSTVVGGEPVPVLSWEDLLLTLCVNGLKDQWVRLRLVCDVAHVAAQIQDWDTVWERAERTRSLRALRIALLLAAREAGAVLPDEVLRRAQEDARASEVAGWIQQSLAREPHEMKNAERARLNLRSQDGLLGQARYLAFVTLRRLTEWYVDPPPPPRAAPAAAREA